MNSSHFLIHYLPEFSDPPNTKVRSHSNNFNENTAHYSQSGHKNATPSSNTAPLAYYYEVSPHGY